MHISRETAALSLFNRIEIKALTLRYARAENASDWNWSISFLPFNVFYYITEGSIEAELIGENGAVIRKQTMTAGNAYLLPYGCAFNMYTKEGFSKYYMHAEINIREGVDLFRGFGDILSCPYDGNVWKDVRLDCEDDTWFTALKAKHLAYETLCALFASNEINGIKKQVDSFTKYPPELASALHYISENISAELTVGEILAEVGLSATTFGNMFKKYLDTTPKSFISTRLYEKSCGLLLTTDMSLKQIALELDFNTPFAFSKFFKKHSGYSPAHYRRLFM